MFRWFFFISQFYSLAIRIEPFNFILFRVFFSFSFQFVKYFSGNSIYSDLNPFQIYRRFMWSLWLLLCHFFERICINCWCCVLFSIKHRSLVGWLAWVLAFIICEMAHQIAATILFLMTVLSFCVTLFAAPARRRNNFFLLFIYDCVTLLCSRLV